MGQSSGVKVARGRHWSTYLESVMEMVYRVLQVRHLAGVGPQGLGGFTSSSEAPVCWAVDPPGCLAMPGVKSPGLEGDRPGDQEGPRGQADSSHLNLSVRPLARNSLSHKLA